MVIQKRNSGKRTPEEKPVCTTGSKRQSKSVENLSRRMEISVEGLTELKVELLSDLALPLLSIHRRVPRPPVEKLAHPCSLLLYSQQLGSGIGVHGPQLMVDKESVMHTHNGILYSY